MPDFRAESLSLARQGDIFRSESAPRAKRGGSFRSKSIRLAGQGGVFRSAISIRGGQNEAFRPDGSPAGGPNGDVRSNGSLPAKDFAAFRTDLHSIFHAARGYRMAGFVASGRPGVKGGFLPPQGDASKGWNSSRCEE